jgi:hypothetical protein
MASSNFKLFDENKTNMMQDGEYGINNQRLNGLQSGIASSMLQNKFQYQMSLISYAIGQLMVQNNIDANDSQAVSTFVNNLSNTFLQKVIDKATTGQAQAGTDDTKWLTPALVKAFYDYRKASVEEAKAGTDQNKFITPYTLSNFVGEELNKFIKEQFIFPNQLFKEIPVTGNSFTIDDSMQLSQILILANGSITNTGSSYADTVNILINGGSTRFNFGIPINKTVIIKNISSLYPLVFNQGEGDTTISWYLYGEYNWARIKLGSNTLNIESDRGTSIPNLTIKLYYK